MRHVLFALVMTGCSSPDCGDGISAAQLTIQSADMTVEIATNPYALTVRDASGTVVLDSGTLGWTSGTMGIGKALYTGYVFLNPNFDPWREDLRVVAATQTDQELDVSLHGSDGTCIHVSHILRDGALRVEAHSDGTPSAWEIGFSSPADEGFLGLGERYDMVDHRGLEVYNWPEEGGLTTGESDPPSADNPYPNGGTMTYYPVPFLLSTSGYAFWLDTTYFNQFELASETPDAWRAWEVGPMLAFRDLRAARRPTIGRGRCRCSIRSPPPLDARWSRRIGASGRGVASTAAGSSTAFPRSRQCVIRASRSRKSTTRCTSCPTATISGTRTRCARGSSRPPRWATRSS